MGDRVVVTFTDDTGELSPAVYMHSGGGTAEEFIRQAQPLMRRGDPSYAAGRFCGFCHKQDPDRVTDLGLVNPKAAEQDWEDYSHGDAGVYVVNVDSGQVLCFGGYGKSFKLDPEGFPR